MKALRMGLGLLVLVGLAACVPGGGVATPGPVQATHEPATPTPEIFMPLDPSPTPSGSTLPLTCQVTDLQVYVNEAGGYCFAYPAGFEAEVSAAGDEMVNILGPALDNSPEPLRASLVIEVQPVLEGSDLAGLVSAYLSQAVLQNLPTPIEQSSMILGGEAAERLDGVPGRLSSRVVMALHGETLFMLRFHPTDAEAAAADLEALFQTVSGSFAFLSAGPQALATSKPLTASWLEFGETFSLDYDGALAPWVETMTVAAVPMDAGGLWAEAHPAYATFRFLGVMGGRPYDLPLLPFDNRTAQVRVFQTADFAGYAVGDYRDFPAQWAGLQDLLNAGVDPAQCAVPLAEPDAGLPMLPWIYAEQVFCAQPQEVAFGGGRGVRYLTFYAQDESPALEHQVFYTFQGLSDDGRFYVAAFFPAATGVFPTELPAGQTFPDPDYLATLTEQVRLLNGQPGESMTPQLAVLDEMIASLRFEP